MKARHTVTDPLSSFLPSRNFQVASYLKSGRRLIIVGEQRAFIPLFNTFLLLPNTVLTIQSGIPAPFFFFSIF